MAELRGFKHTQERFLHAANGDLIGFLNANGTTRYFPAGQADNAITATVGGGQANGIQLNYRISRVTTVASAADSVKLPAALPGMSMTVINAAAANAMTIYPASGEAINALSADAGLSVAANKTILFTCAVAGTWNSNLTA